MMSPRLVQLSVLLVLVLSSRLGLPQGKLEPFGLEDKRVARIDLVSYLTLHSPLANFLYAVTDSEGVYRRDLRSDTAWSSIGLNGKKLTALDIQVWGAGPADFHAPVVGVKPDYSKGDSTLIYRLENDAWVPADSGLARDQIQVIQTLASFASTGHAPPGDAFAGGNALIYRSRTFQRNWTESLDMGIGVTNVIEATPGVFNGDVWAGGETAIFAPWIARSRNAGGTWEIFYPDLSGDNACNSLAIHPTDSNTVYAGMEGAVIKTNDGGDTWTRTGLRDTPVYFYGLALDPFDANHIYAGGTIADPSSWAMWESFDAGATWAEIPSNAAKPSAGIKNLVADQNLQGVVYIATFGDGVWRYQSGTTKVDERDGQIPRGFALNQNYPNPFTPLDNLSHGKSFRGRTLSNGVNPETVIQYSIAASQHVQLEIYNTRGQLLVTLVNERKTAGTHSVRWNGTDATGANVPSGIYVYRLQLNGTAVAAQKMTLVR